MKIESVGLMSAEFRKNVNFIITLGGDGTILWASKQFSGEYVPPIITFDQGSLGFLCNFVFKDHKQILTVVFQ
jgi:NAD kinase